MYQLNGLTYVGTPPSAYPETAITRAAFRNRFTFMERVAIKTAESSTPMLQVLADDQAQATYVDLSDLNAAAGLDLLVAFGLLTPERKDKILTTPIDVSERPL